MNKFTLPVLLVLLAFLWACAEQSREMPAATVTGNASMSATIESIDYATRHVTLRDNSTGQTMAFKVGDYAHNFNQLKVGDKVDFKYKEALALSVEKPGELMEPKARLSVERAPLGSTPGGVISETVTTNARVDDIDYTTRHLTLTGPEGNTINLKVGDHVKRLNEVRKGDMIVVQYTKALGVSVTPK